VADKYRVERVLGRGGMGVVVEAQHVTLGTRVALKFLDAAMACDATARARFTREARASAQLSSEHICRVSDFGIQETPGGAIPYIVMELLSGTDLARLCKVRVLDVSTAALYVRQACQGLAVAHAAGIIHRDLKPGNLFLTRRADGRPLIKVLDFGVATAPEGDDAVQLTAPSAVIGSQGFMAPEQLRSGRSADARSDVWSLGIILHKLLTGAVPYKAASFAEFALAIAREPTPPMPTIVPAFAAVIAKCLEKDPANRYQDVHALAEALAPFAAQARGSGVQVMVSPDDPDAQKYLDALGVPARPTPPPGDVALTAPTAAATPAARVVPKTVVGTAPMPAQRPTAPAVAPTTDAATQVVPAHAQQTRLGTPVPEPATRAPSEREPAQDIRSKPTVAATAVGAGAPIVTPLGELPPGLVVGEYRIERKIGEGGMGAVYGAVHPLIGKKAAIKVISADLGGDPVVVERFVQEARSVNQIGHPNIVDVFAFGKLPDGRNYFVMELLQGESLRERLTRSFIPLSDGIQILDEVASALEAAHEKQIVHRDLKPDNVYLASLRNSVIQVKLLDFGIAKLSDEGNGLRKTSTGEMMGTPGYLSPEQARGRDVDFRTDIYALGCMIFEVVTGRIPFIAESPMDVVLAHITTPPPRPSQFKPDVPPALDQIILQMLDKDPAMRPPIAAVRDMFAELVASGMVPLDVATGVTFRSELARNTRGEARTPGSGRARRASAAGAQGPTVRNRNPSPSEAPTAHAPNAASASVTPGASSPNAPTWHASPSATPHDAGLDLAAPPRSRRGLWIALVALVLAAGGITAAVVLGGGTHAPAMTAGTTGTTPAATPTAAGVSAATAPAPVLASGSASASGSGSGSAVAVRAVTLSLDVPGATLEIDGARVAVVDGTATAALSDGAHQVDATAPGRQPLHETIEVTATTTTLTLQLARVKASAAKKPARTVKKRPTGAVKPPIHHADDTIDPFAN
jgi:serine/threonine-protein kinase